VARDDVLSEESRRAVEALAAFPLPGSVPVDEWRAALPLALATVVEPGPELLRVWDDVVVGEDGPGVPVRAYLPDAACTDVLVYVHGGGWVGGSIETHDALVRRLAVALGCAAISVGYRLAPENPYPAGLNDVLTTLARAREVVEAGGASARGWLAIGGDSAGGNLAAAAAIAARDGGPLVDLQLLVDPVLREHRLATPSPSAGDFPGIVDILRWEWDQYVPGAPDGVDPLVAPDVLHDHRGLPPAVIVTAEHDVLALEASDYARRLEEAGVGVAFREVPGAIHGFLLHTRVGDEADRELAWLVAAARRLLPT
jgi:acetyl esterase